MHFKWNFYSAFFRLIRVFCVRIFILSILISENKEEKNAFREQQNWIGEDRESVNALCLCQNTTQNCQKSQGISRKAQGVCRNPQGVCRKAQGFFQEREGISRKVQGVCRNA